MVWSVRNRLRALSLCWVLSLVLLGGMGLHWLRQETALAQRFLDNDFVAAVEVGEIRAALGHMRRYEKEMFLDMGDEQRLAALTRDWQAQLATVQRTMESLRPRVDAVSQTSVDAFDAGVQTYAKGVLAVLEAIRVGQISDPWKADEFAAMQTGKAGMAAADRAFDVLRTAMEDKARQQTAGMQTSTDLALYSSVAALLVFGLLALALARGIGRSVVMPLDQACSLADAVARGDLTHVIDADGHDEIAQLRRALIRMQSSLAEVVGTLQHTATDIETATHEVAGGNHDLSHRTERAASHLQETAASLHELTTAVAQSSSTASQALVVVQQVAESAHESGAAVSGFVDTMQAIQTSSKRINDITAVIDSIAFQTNILALNAAVEAARAGEQGRGFSVVASEVRQLAQRSGEAAREIRGLIVNAGQLVARGSADVARAGTHVHSLVQGVQQVREYVQVMAHNTHEQDRGLGQIHQAVEQIDQMTQQNAALVEESAAAAQSLRDQAARLAEVVRSFQVDPAKAPAVAYRVLPQLT